MLALLAPPRPPVPPEPPPPPPVTRFCVPPEPRPGPAPFEPRELFVPGEVAPTPPAPPLPAVHEIGPLMFMVLLALITTGLAVLHVKVIPLLSVKVDAFFWIGPE